MVSTFGYGGEGPSSSPGGSNTWVYRNTMFFNEYRFEQRVHEESVGVQVRDTIILKGSTYKSKLY